MTPGVVHERATHIADVRADATADRAAITTALTETRCIRAWLDSQEAALVRRLGEVDSFPEATIAATSKGSLNSANRITERASTLTESPTLATALDNGAITAGHIDAITRAAKGVGSDRRGELLERVDALADVAAAATVEQFASRIQLEVKRLHADDGEERLVRQRRNVRLRSWVDGDGMWNLRGRFDPVAGARLATTLDRTVGTVFAEQTPELCPDDPIEKQQFLAAHALIRLIESPTPSGRGRSECVVVVDADAPGRSGPVAQWAIPVEVPSRVLAELADDADRHVVVVRNGVVLHAPGRLDLGRSSRLANRAQRRALRGLYRHCAIPGCRVAYERCKLHHVVWWHHGGCTDLSNLRPVCAVHHTKIHHDGWVVELGPSRQLTLRLPDGTIRNTGPPTIRAA